MFRSYNGNIYKVTGVKSFHMYRLNGEWVPASDTEPVPWEIGKMVRVKKTVKGHWYQAMIEMAGKDFKIQDTRKRSDGWIIKINNYWFLDSDLRKKS